MTAHGLAIDPAVGGFIVREYASNNLPIVCASVDELIEAVRKIAVRQSQEDDIKVPK